MQRFQILQLDEGGGNALAWAKRQARRMSEGGVRDFARTWNFAGFTVAVRSVSAGTDEMVKVRIISQGDGAVLYGWTPQNNGNALGPCRFALQQGDTTKLPASSRVTAVGLPAQATALSFAVKTFSDPSFVETPLLTRSRITGLLERLVRRNSLFAQQALGWLIGRTTITRHGQTLRTVLGDCILSRWNAGEFYLLLGSFPRSGEDPTTPAGAALVDQPYTGVVVAWSALKKALVESAPTLFTLNLDDPAIVARDVGTDYTRKDVYVSSSVPITGGNLVSQCFHVPTTSPYASVYEIVAGPSVAPGTAATHTHDWEVHRLTSDGTILVDDMTRDLARGTSTASFTFSTESVTPVSCDLSFFSGDALVPVGTHTSSGAASLSAPLSFVETLQVPVVSGFHFGMDAFGILLYIPELNAVYCDQGDGTLGITFLGKATYTGSRTTTLNALPPVDPAPFSGIAAPYLQSTRATTVGGVVPTETETVVGVGPYVDLTGGATAVLYPQASGAPGLVPYDTTFTPGVISGHTDTALGGIYWPRDAGLAVLLFTLPTDLTVRANRAADVTKYQNIFNGVVGYRRIVHADGSITFESGYEDPELVIARIAAATNVLVNNFASPALLPWLVEGLVGVVLDS